jgi:hypothetical protein
VCTKVHFAAHTGQNRVLQWRDNLANNISGIHDFRYHTIIQMGRDSSVGINYFNGIHAVGYSSFEEKYYVFGQTQSTCNSFRETGYIHPLSVKF